MTLNQYTQLCINALLPKSNLKVDGIIGENTKKAMKSLIYEIKTAFAFKKYEWLPNGNFLAVRMDDVYTNQFTDWAIIASDNSMIAFPVSTKPGWSWTKNESYIKNIAGGKGVACVKPGQYKKIWRFRDNGWTGRPHLVQVRNCTVFRDNDMDDLIDKTVTETGLFGINFHTHRGFFSTLVKNLSAGCIVCREVVFNLIWDYVKELCEFGDINFTLLEKSDI